MQDEGTANAIADRVIEAAALVHRRLGPGLLKSVYAASLAYELAARGLSVEQRKPLAYVQSCTTPDCGRRVDLLVNNAVIIELKTVEGLDSVHVAQLRSYLTLSGLRVGLLIDFNVSKLEQGIRLVVNQYGGG